MAKENSAFMKPLKVSPELAAVVGAGPMPRSEVVKKLWMYIKGDEYVDDKGKKGSSLRKGPTLQDLKKKRNIIADANLKVVFGGKAVVDMFEMTKLVSAHLSSK
jgi:chromatin remodeling complex protein RSC6